MADKKISALTSSTTPLAGTEVLPIVQSGATVKVSVSNLTAGRAVAATSIQFGSGTVLSVYEEGTWTPNQGPGLTVVGAFTSSGTYTKVGRQVTINGEVKGATSIAGASGGTICTNLPFASSVAFAGSVGIANVNQGSTLIVFSTVAYLSTPITPCAGINFTATYFV
jgi:hypothetical protein